MIDSSFIIIVDPTDLTYDMHSSSVISVKFTKLLIEFEQLQKRSARNLKKFWDAVEDTVDATLLLLPQNSLDQKVLSHPLLLFLREILLNLLNNWCVSHSPLSFQETDIFLKIIFIFVHIAEQLLHSDTQKNAKTKTNALLIKDLLLQICKTVENSILNSSVSINDPNIYALGLLTINLLIGYPFFYTIEQYHNLSHYLVMDWLYSYDFIEAVHRLERDETLSHIEYTILFTCWEYLSSTFLIKQNCSTEINSMELIYSICDEFLTQLEHAYAQSSRNSLSELTYIFDQYEKLLRVSNLPSFERHAKNIIDQLIKVFRNPLVADYNDELMITFTLNTFYKLTKNPKINKIMKKSQLNTIFDRYTSTEAGEQKRLALLILAEIMDGKEINNNPTQMVALFIDQLKSIDQNESNPDLDNTLSSLEALMEYEQIKDEFVKQGGLEPLISFVRDGDTTKQSEKQLEDAIRILWSCTFNNADALNTLKQDEKLMTRVHEVLEKSKETGNAGLEKAALRLIWKVEKEEKFLAERTAHAEKKKQEKVQKVQQSDSQDVEEEIEEKEEEKYDLMISYSWADMDLAHRIFQHLTEDLGYKVWIDKEQMHGSTIEAMANAVEGAEFILMCMSETYKRSDNCKSEAEYAFNRKKYIVPIKMKKDYVPDGWLGFILGTRMYIDFEKHEFDKAIELLHNEIQLQKKKNSLASETDKIEKNTERDNQTIADTTAQIESFSEQVEVTLNSSDIESWNENLVKDFLNRNNLLAFVPLCNGISGHELYTLYGMCKQNSVVMYRSLKSELEKCHDIMLPISSYLRFISLLDAATKDDSRLDAHVYRKDSDDLIDDQ